MSPNATTATDENQRTASARSTGIEEATTIHLCISTPDATHEARVAAQFKSLKKQISDVGPATGRGYEASAMPEDPRDRRKPTRRVKPLGPRTSRETADEVTAYLFRIASGDMDWHDRCSMSAPRKDS